MTVIKALSHRAYVNVAGSEVRLTAVDAHSAVRRSRSNFVVTLYRDGSQFVLMVDTSLTRVVLGFLFYLYCIGSVLPPKLIIRAC